MLCWGPQADCVVVNVNCHELTANFGELIFFNLRIIYGDSRSYKKPLESASELLLSGIVRNEPGMVGNDFLEKLLGIAD